MKKMVKPYLCLMVKDEEKRIKVTLDSCLGFINRRIFVYDTGSTDMTIPIIRDFCQTHCLELYLEEGNFVDFSISRNHLLNMAETRIFSDMCGQDCFMLVMDANDELRVEKECDFEEIFGSIPETIDVLRIQSTWNTGKEIYYHLKHAFIRVGRNTRYVGSVHEELMTFGTYPKSAKFQFVSLYQDRAYEHQSTAARYTRDIEFLQSDIAKGLNPARSTYFLARAYRNAQKYHLAITEFNNRLKYPAQQTANDQEERYNSHIYIGDAISMVDDERIDLDPSIINHYLEAFQILPRVAPLSRLTIYYMKRNKWNCAYLFAKQATLLPAPKQDQIQISTSEYTFFRWYNLALVCLHTGLIEEGGKALDQIHGVPPDHEGKISLLHQQYANLYQKFGTGERPLALVFGGYYYYQWNGSSINQERGLGGSETVAVRMSEELHRCGFEVVLCCNTEGQTTVNGVHYYSLEYYQEFLQKYHIDLLLVYRHADKLYYGPNVVCAVLSLEDLIPVGGYLPLSPKLQAIICKSNWHRSFLVDKYPRLGKRIIVVGNAIDRERFMIDPVPQRTPWRFIYSSCVLRGLNNLLRLFPKIREIVPEAELHVFADFDCPYYKDKPQVVRLHCDLIMTEGVVLHPRVSQKILAEEILKSDIWLYPTTFKETYCITALEMQMGGVKCIYTKCGALPEVIGERGVMISVDPNNPDNDFLFLKAIEDLRDGKITEGVTETRIRRGKEWARQQTWEAMCKLFIDYLGGKKGGDSSGAASSSSATS